MAAAGCDVVFGLEGAGDGPSVTTCPEIGAGPPMFGTSIEVVLPRACFYLTLSKATGLAYASCGAGIEEGPVNGPLQPIAITASLPGATLDRPGIAPEGDRMIVRQLSSPIQRMSWYARELDRWTWLGDLIDTTGFATPGTPSAAPDRRAIVATNAGFHELVENADVWTELRLSPWSTLGVTGGAHTHLSRDALRLTFVVSSMVMYADRADRNAAFGLAAHVATAGATDGAFITEDCARVYYSTNGAVVYRRQL